MNVADRKKMLTPQDVAEWANVSERTVRREIEAGRLPARRFGAKWRIDPDDLEAWGRSNPADDDNGEPQAAAG